MRKTRNHEAELSVREHLRLTKAPDTERNLACERNNNRRKQCQDTVSNKTSSGE